MGQPYVGEIRMFAGNFAPVGWAFCNGALLAISDYSTLFNLIGTTYGGDGQTTFALPDLQGRLPVHMGNGFTVGQKAGVETVTLTASQIPVHTHVAAASTNNQGSASPTNNFWAASPQYTEYAPTPDGTAMAATAIGTAGGNQPHDNMVPFLAINFILALYGVYPSQT